MSCIKPCDRPISRGGNLRWPWTSLQYSRFQEHFNFVRICWNCSKSIKMTNHISWKRYLIYLSDLLTWPFLLINYLKCLNPLQNTWNGMLKKMFHFILKMYWFKNIKISLKISLILFMKLIKISLILFMKLIKMWRLCSAVHSIIQTILWFKLQRSNQVIDSIKLYFQETLFLFFNNKSNEVMLSSDLALMLNSCKQKGNLKTCVSNNLCSKIYNRK